jgi:putative ABC transport system permease protein
VALGVAIVVAIHVMDHNTIRSRLLERQADFGAVDLELVPLDAAREPTAVRDGLAALPAVRDVGVLHPGLVSFGQAERLAGTAQIYGLSPLPSSAFAHYRVDEGHDLLDLDGDAHVLIGRDLADAFRLRPGDRISLQRPSATPRALCRGGRRVVIPETAEPPAAPVEVSVKGVLARERLGRRNLGFVVVSSYALARRLAPNERSLFQINRHAGSNVDELRQTLSRDFQVLDARSALLGESADERAFRNGVKVLGCLALVLGMFVVFQTLSQSLVERLKQIGLLRCLGTRRRTVASIFLLDALATAVIGAVLGVLLGLVLAFVLQSLNVTTLGVGKRVRTFEVPWGPIAWTAALGVLFTLAGAGFPLFKARNVPALLVLHARGLHEEGEGGGAYVLRGVNTFLFVMLVLVLPGAYLAMTPLLSQEGRETLLVLGQLGAMLLLFGGVLLVAPGVVRRAGVALLRPLRPLLRLPTFLLDKALRRNPGRYAASVCGLAVVLLALVSLKHITFALRGEVRAFGAVTMEDRLFLRCEAPITPAEASKLEQLPAVVSADVFEGRAQQAPFELSGYDVARLTRPGGLFASDAERAAAYSSARSMIVSKRLAQLRRLGPGDALAVLTDEGPKPYTVLAVSDAAGFFPDERAWAIADPRFLREDFCVEERSVDRIVLRMQPGAGVETVLAAVRQVVPQATWAKSGEWLTNYHTRDVTRDFFLFDVLLALILLLAGVGLVNAMTIAAMGRAREVGVLRALGMRKRALRATYLLEGVLVALMATGIVWLAGVPLGAMVVAGLNKVAGLEAPVVIPWVWFAVVPALALGIGVVAAVLPSTRVLRESPAEAVRYE